jgi:hypothetical protein
MTSRRSALGMLRPVVLLLIWEALAGHAVAIPDMRFDVVTFCCDCTGSLLCQTQFDHLNFPSANGHYIAMGTDTYRTNLLANGNLLAIYYNNFDSDYDTNVTAAQEASAINQYSLANFTSTGPRPTWLVLNEISSGNWPGNQTYRTWVENVVQTLATNYGYSVIVYSPFPNPGANAPDWQAVSSNGYIAVENYLSGQAIAAEDFSVGWCQDAYESSIIAYNALGVSASRLILGEHFGQTLTNTGYGRSGVSSNNWDSAINVRSQAALNDGFVGFIGYDWGNDAMDVSEDDMVHYEDTYASNPLPDSGALTLPYPALEPQNQTAPPGATVMFTVVPAGDAPVTFQWSFNGRHLTGSTGGILNLTNIGPTDGGTYAVLLSNEVGSAWSSNAILSVAIPAPLSFDPFAYSVGADLIGQTNAQGLSWYQAGPDSALTNQPVIQSSNLYVPGLAFPVGNSAGFGGGGGMAARFPIANGTGITSGTVYYSFLLKLTNIAGLSSSGVFWAGFNDTTGAQTSTPSVVATRVYTRAAGGGFNFGLSKASSTSSDWQWDTAVHHLNETIFLVGSYTFNSSSTNDDVAELWIDPAPSAFGQASAPPATLDTASGGDISPNTIASFLLMNRDPTEPAGGLVDELRLGSSWASVAPPAGSLPVLTIAQNSGTLILSWSTNATGFNLYSSPILSNKNTWTLVPAPVSIVAGQYTVSSAWPAASEFFRLRLP